MTMAVPHDVVTAAEPHHQEENASPESIIDDVLNVHSVCPSVVARTEPLLTLTVNILIVQ